MTDNEIIKALESAIHRYKDATHHVSCIVDINILKKSINLIKRQKAEIERLDQESGILEEELEDRSKDIYDLISKERSNAILEFAEALKQESEDDFVSVDLIDSVVKDMTEVEE